MTFVMRVLDTLVAFYWFLRGHFTLKEVWLVMTGKAKLGFREDF